MAYEHHHFIDTSGPVWNYSFFVDDDVKLFSKGELFTAYEKFGAHPLFLADTAGFYFAVWAPHAEKVSVIGDFNGWKPELHVLFVKPDNSGIWEGFIPDIPSDALYKFHIIGKDGSEHRKADPYARYAQLRPETASVTRDGYFEFSDEEWMQVRAEKQSLRQPWNIYEVHLGSWMRPDPADPMRFNSYPETAERLLPYVKAMGYTHVEIMPVTEHPHDDSWGYQTTGYFAPTSRYGVPEDLKQFINRFHQEGIGVILDWVPSHFASDAHGLFNFDGAHTYEYADRRKGYHPDWHSYIFNYKRGEVQSFLLSSAHFWLSNFHADGLRVDAVNSMIRLDFSRNAGEWEPNEEGGAENLEAIHFLQKLNKMVQHQFPGVCTIAEDSSDHPGITAPVSKGGLGFNMKWMLGWMHDTLDFFKEEPQHRPEHKDKITFSIMYFYNEHFLLPLSHDEVVHGKSPMLYKLPGNEWEKFAELRLLYAYMITHPGAKLLFMGNEFGQTSEWNHHKELDWPLLQYEPHNKLQECVRRLNWLYREMPALHHYQFSRKGFEWVDLSRMDKGLLIFKRCGARKADDILVLLNVSAHEYHEEVFEMTGKLHWKEIFNSDDINYWGSGNCMNTELAIRITDKKTRRCEIKPRIPALSALIFA